ncbi:MAG: hypothetical protein PHP79_05700, partial [Clostridia bacterium]|nr:hypothetical protein [Clostridia bacterium]
MGSKKYAGIVVDQTHPSLDKLFYYYIPDELAGLAQVGVRVQVPFGPRSLQGYILTVDEKVDIPEEKIRPIKKLLDPAPVLNPSIISLILWMKSEYHCMLIEAIRCFIPPGLRLNIKKKTQRVAILQETDSLEDWIHQVEARSPNMASILRILEDEDRVP